MGVHGKYAVLFFLLHIGTWSTVFCQLHQPDIELARCRSRCLEFLALEVNDEECQKDGNCKMCWETCEYLQWEPNKWNVMCNVPHICFPGCQSSCEYWENHSEVESVPPPHELSETIRCSYSNGALRLEWESPVIGTPSNNFIYILSSKNLDDPFADWYMDIQTADTWVEYEMAWFPFLKFQFQLLVVTENGTVAISETGALDIAQLMNAPTSVPSTTTVLPDPLNISVTVEWDNSSTYAYVHWQQTSAERTDYSVFWGLETCNVDPSLPECTVVPDYYATYITDSLEGDVEVKLNADLTFNSKFWVQVECSTSGVLSPKAYFYTPGCENPDSTYTVCLPIEELKEEEYNVTEWSLELGEFTYIHADNLWGVNISWPTPSHGVPTVYNVSWMTDFREGDSTFISGWISAIENHVVLRLPGGQFYQVGVEAVYADPELTQDSVLLFFNTSELVPDNKSITDNTANNETDTDKETTNSKQLIIIVSVSVSAAVFLFSLANIFLWRWKSNRTIETKARAMARSNSYMSCSNSPKFNSDDQLVSVHDKWEVDPKLITFGHQLGQGAFGRVLTGCYNGKKVAIKMIKKNAPPSSKEDLLAEICLMKKIGPHPNIVSIIGSCTVREPQALIMEYMPQGNLLNFLRCCRFDGQLKTEGFKQKAISYPMVNEDGSIEQDTITSKELLSFARQISLAMEYLSSKGFVHRDLAARNVLVGKNKVVKLCDFGLSRDIYKELEYHKDTSGKLPLRWMAPESLKDCIYTVQTDVWTFGILLWEICTLGASPYPDIALPDLFTKLDQGVRMSSPKNCSTELYILMLQCWHKAPGKRPSFTSIRLALEDMMSQDCEYLELDNILDTVLEDEEKNAEDEENDKAEECDDKSEMLPREKETDEDDDIEEVLEPRFSRKRSLKQTLSQLSSMLDSPRVLKKSSLKSQISGGSNVSSPRLSLKGSIRRKMSVKQSRSQENLINEEKDESGCESCSETQLDKLDEKDFSYYKQRLHALKSTHL